VLYQISTEFADKQQVDMDEPRTIWKSTY